MGKTFVEQVVSVVHFRACRNILSGPPSVWRVGDNLFAFMSARPNQTLDEKGRIALGDSKEPSRDKTAGCIHVCVTWQFRERAIEDPRYDVHSRKLEEHGLEVALPHKP